MYNKKYNDCLSHPTRSATSMRSSATNQWTEDKTVVFERPKDLCFSNEVLNKNNLGKLIGLMRHVVTCASS